MALIDIILPTKNNGTWLKASVSSLLQQTLNDIRIIIIDDHSTDNSLSFLPKSKKIEIITNKGFGLVDALNTGIDKSDCKWIARSDGDDINNSLRLEKQLQLAEIKQLDWVSCQVESFDHPDQNLGYPRFVDWHNSIIEDLDIKDNIFRESTMIHPTWFLKRKIFDNQRYRKGDFPEDYDFLLKNINQYRTGKVEELLYYWRDSPKRVSRISEAFKRDKFLKLKIEYIKIPEKRPVYIIGAGEDGKKINRILRKKNIIPAGFIDLSKGRENMLINHTKVYSPSSFILQNHTYPPYLISTIKKYGYEKTLFNWLKKINFNKNKDYVILN